MLFDGTQYLFRDYFNATNSAGDPLLPDTYTGTYSVWFKTDATGQIPEFLTTWGNLISTHNVFFYNGDSGIYLQALSTNLEMYPGQYAEGNVLPPPTLSPNTWYHQAASWNTDFATGMKVFQIYLNAADLGAANNWDTTSGPALVAWSYYPSDPGQGDTIVLPDLLNDGDYGPATTTTMADFQLWDRVFVDLSVPANLAKFISNGKPVDPTIAAAAFGQQTLLFSGDKDTFGNNQGTGGAYNLAKPLFANGRNGAGPISLPGAIAGQPVLSVIDATNGVAGGNTGNFETTISVNDQIQQISSADLSGSSFIFNVPGTLTDAVTSPSN